jgi:hypothetical protein
MTKKLPCLTLITLLAACAAPCHADEVPVLKVGDWSLYDPDLVSWSVSPNSIFLTFKSENDAKIYDLTSKSLNLHIPITLCGKSSFSPHVTRAIPQAKFEIPKKADTNISCLNKQKLVDLQK